MMKRHGNVFSRDCASLSVGSETFPVVTLVRPQTSSLTGIIAHVPFHLSLCNPDEDKRLVLCLHPNWPSDPP